MDRLIETIRFENGKLHLLEYHQRRFDRSRRELFDHIEPIDLGSLITPPDSIDSTGIYKVRVIYDHQIHAIEWHNYQMKPVHSLQVVEDNEIEYHLKWLDRSRLDTLVSQTATDSIVIVKEGMVTDSAYANIILFDGEQWVTPDTPLLRGVMREYLLDIGIIEERRITVDNLAHYQLIALINAMIPFGKCEPLSTGIIQAPLDQKR